MNHILTAFGLDQEKCDIQLFGSGLINRTWTVVNGEGKYILQKINDAIFKKPDDIAWNIDLLDSYIQANHKDYFFTSPVRTIDNKSMVYVKGEGYFRMFPFVNQGHSIDVVETPHQAYEAAKQFGKFTRLLSGLDSNALRITLPSFHNLSLRYEQFLDALENGNKDRIIQAATLIDQLKGYVSIAEAFEKIKGDPAFKLRVTHHDTKISNVLFDDHDNGICVIDLDTIMPGYFISDVGDMMRTYLSPVSEEEKNFDKIQIRDEFYKSIVKGYREEMEPELTETEMKYFFYSGTFMIYMQALRFLTDHLNNDVYYGARYPDHNFIRARNQAILLERLMEKKDILSAY